MNIVRTLAAWVQSFFYGLWLPFQAGRLILGNRKLLLWSAIPFVLTIILSIYGVAQLKAFFMSVGMQYLTGLGVGPDSFTAQAAVFVFSLLSILLAIISFSFLAGVLASPFNDFLAEATEPHAALPPPPADAATWGFRLKTIAIDAVKTAAVTALQLFSLVLTFIMIWVPILNVLLLLLTFLLLTFQFVSYPQTRRGEGLVVGIRFLWRHKFACVGFGITIGSIFALPFVSGFALPLAVVGGTLLYGRAQQTQELK